MRRACPLCGCRLKPSNRTKDHFVPKVRGGSGAPQNVWVMCKRCNNKKGSRLPNAAEARAMQSYQARHSNAEPETAIREAKPRSVRSDDRVEMRRDIMNRYEKTLAYLAGIGELRRP